MDEQIILSLTDEELFKLFTAKAKDLKDSELIKNKDIEKVRYGIDIEFDLYNYFKYKDSMEWGLFRIKPKSKLINIEGNGYVRLSDFNTEMEGRKSIMINALLEYYADLDPSIEQDTDGMEEIIG